MKNFLIILKNGAQAHVTAAEIDKSDKLLSGLVASPRLVATNDAGVLVAEFVASEVVGIVEMAAAPGK